MSTWHPGAKRVGYPDAGGWAISAPPRLVWHTTEGSSLPRYAGSAPHFTLDPITGALYQHIPINLAAMALKHPTGTVHTNHAHAIQVELIGFSDTAFANRVGKPQYAVVNWGDKEYANIAKLARWIEANAGVPRTCSVKFYKGVPRLSSSAWLRYSGHLGHMHVPNNDHWDPCGLQIDKVLALPAQPAKTTPKVDPVRALKRAVRLIPKRYKRARRSVTLALGAVRRRK